MVENDWSGMAAHRRAAERDDLWPPLDMSEMEGEAGLDRIGDARAFVTAGASGGSNLAERAAAGLGALTAVALVVGLGAWTWDLAVRDLSGIPVVRALEGPARTAPEEPGGDVAEHQGLAVNAIQAARDEEPGPGRLLLAPDAQGLAEDDVAVEVARAPAPAADPIAGPASSARPGEERFRTAGLGMAKGDRPIVMLASAEADGSDEATWAGARIDAQPEAVDPIKAALVEAMGVPAPEGEAPSEGAAIIPAAAAIGPGGAVERSPRPSERPEAVAAAVEAAVSASAQLARRDAFPEEDGVRAQ